MEHRPLDLADFRGKNRLLLLFTPDEQETGYETQCSLLDESDTDFAEHDLLLVCVIGDGGHVGRRSLTVEEAHRLREHFEVPPEGFILVLIGKDGAELRRDQAPVKPEALLADMDADAPAQNA